MKLNKGIKLSILLLSVSGCSLAPDYKTPDVPLADRWIGIALKEQQKNNKIYPDQIGWRNFFLDKKLQKLIETALIYNHDLRKAALRVELTQAQYGITRADKFPSIGLNGGYSRNRIPTGNISEQYNVGLGIANFELDFFGRIHNLSEAALNSYLATKEAHDAAKLSIINAVAKTYYQREVAQALKDLAHKTLVTRQESYHLTELRFKEGIASGTDISTALSTVASARSSYQQQLRSMRQAENALATLVGQPVTTLDLPEKRNLFLQFPEQILFADIPSTSLLKRPDIRQAEYHLKGANANIGAARAAMFPSISLTSNAGYASTELNHLIGGTNRTWSFAPSINLPIFTAGKLSANVTASEINKKIAIENYQQTVQAAFRDINNALVARETLEKQYQAEKAGQEATAETLRLVKLQVEEGLADGLNLLDAERADFATKQGLLTTLLQTLNNKVDLYTALGGGLEETTETNITK